MTERQRCTAKSSPLSIITNPVFFVSAVTLVGLLLRLRGVTWGLPHLYDPDEPAFVDPAVRFVTTGDLNPHRFGHPASTLMYLLGLAYLVYWLLGHLVGWFPDLRFFETLFRTDPTVFYLIGRGLTLLLSTLAIPLTYMVGRRVTGQSAALAAATFVAVSPLHVELSRIVRPDGPLTTLILLTMVLAFKTTERPMGRNFVLSGMCAGLATATKWPGIAAAVPVIMAGVVAVGRQPVTWKDQARWLGVGFLGLGVGFVIAAPFVPLEIQQVVKDLTRQARKVHLSATGGPGLSNYLWYLTGPRSSRRWAGR